MKVADAMRKSVITVLEETPIKEVGRLIFSLGISLLPVVRGKKVVGIITQEDIIAHLFPSMHELVDDYTHARNFEEMEKNLKSVLEIPVKDIMNKQFSSADPSTPLMKAQSMMLVHKFSHLPIVDENNELLGVISQGDIFRYLLRNEIPRIERERYAGFIAENYDLMVDWKSRFHHELPTLFNVFEKEKVKNILDLGSWTGEYSIGIAKNSKYKVLGLDHNMVMVKMAQEKKKKLHEDVGRRVDFMLTDFTDLPSRVKGTYDAAICMGNSLPYIPSDLDHLLKDTTKLLRKKNPVLIMQILNFDKIIKTKDKLLSFQIRNLVDDPQKEVLFMEFFDEKGKDALWHHVVILECDGKNWIYKGITTIPITFIREKDVEKALVKAGFDNIVFSGHTGKYQADYGALSFMEPFDLEKSDWLNVLAQKW